MGSRTWYAAVMSKDDLDFSRGSYNRNEAFDLCEELQAEYLAVVHRSEDGCSCHINLILPTYYAIR